MLIINQIMAEVISKHERNLGALIHASTFSKYIFPFGNFIVPLLLWSANKRDYEFVDHNGREALNFQLSMLLYSIIAGMIGIPFIIGSLPNLFHDGFLDLGSLNELNSLNVHFHGDGGWRLSRAFLPAGITGLVHLTLIVLNIVYSILATVRTADGQLFNYPLSIKFIK